MNRFFSASPIFLSEGIAIVRIIIGAMMVYHGKEIFQPELMKSYTEWDTFKAQGGLTLVYFGKSTEFVAGILLLLGLFTRVGAILLIGTLSYVTFVIGHGKFWYEDQHPFMFVMFGLLFLFTGPGAWSLDGIIRKEDSARKL